MRSVFFWEAAGLSLDRANPYGGLLARAMRGVGVELEAGHPETLTKEWLYENRGQIDVLHLNWPHYMYDAPELSDRLAHCSQIIDNLSLARALGYKVVWTVHNLYPHESGNLDLDHLARLAITRLASALIVHCEHARQLVRQHFHRSDGVFVIPHGNFIGVYPDQVSRAEARRQLRVESSAGADGPGLNEENFVYFFFGNVRRYKGLERLLEVFQSLPGDHLRLLLGAKVYNEYGEKIAAAAAQSDRRVIVRSSRHFANEELQLLFKAADVGIFPFVNVLTSGSVITALSFGRPVIVPAYGCLPELVPPQAGIVYDPEDAEGLRQAMLSIQSRDIAPMCEAAMAHALELDWGRIARQTLEVYGYE